MIDYDVLCRAIEDWKAGNAPRAIATPSRPPPPQRPVAEAAVENYEPVEEAGEEAVEEAVDAGEETGEEAAGEPAAEQTPEDRTIIYHMPEIVDENEEEAV